MNPIVEEVKNQGSMPLPDLFDKVTLDRIKIIQVVEDHELIVLRPNILEDKNIAYHEVEYVE